MRFRPGEDTEFQLERMLNKGLEFQDNMRGSLFEGEFEDGVLEIEHGLDVTPIGFIVIWKDGEGDIWATRLQEWNRTRLFLASNVSNLKVRLFVM